MASIYRILKQIYKSTVPVPMQEMTWSRRYPFWRIAEPIKKFLGKWASHDEIYDRYYFEETVDASAMRSAETICNFIIEVFKPTSVIDVGCGTGALLSILAAANIECIGLENADAAIAIALQRNVKVKKFDLEHQNARLLNWFGLRRIPVLPLDRIYHSKSVIRRPKDIAHMVVLKQLMACKNKLKK